MPYTIRQDGPTGKPWCVYRTGTDERFGCSATRSDAVDMIAAIESGKKKGLDVAFTEEGEVHVKGFSAEATQEEDAQPAPPSEGDRDSQEKSSTESPSPMIRAPEITRYHLLPLEGQPEDFAALLKQYQQKSYSAERCMRCRVAPTKAVIWADGRALAWFCEDHLKEWEQEDERDIVARTTLAEGQDSREWAKARVAAQHDKVQEFPVEEVNTECVCPACGKTIPHKRGSPCSERYCPDCGEPLVGSSKAKERSLKEMLADVWKGINRLLSSEDEHDLGPLSKEAWSTAYINDLPDSAFLYIEEGGEKDDEGKTTPRSLRHLPYKDAEGNVDLPHLRNALSRLGQEQTGTAGDGWLTPSLREKLRKKAEDLLAGQAKAMEGSFYTYKQADGRHRWVAISSTAFVDLDNEIVSVKALERDVERTPQGDRGPLRFWHQKEIDFGDCDFAMVDGLTLIESGLWREDKISKAARQYVEQHPEEFAVSIGFLADTKAIEVGTSLNGKAVRAVYNNILIQERSLLPAMWSSNRFTRIDAGAGGTEDMDKLKREALEKLLGVERASALAATVDGVNAKAIDPGEVFKTADTASLGQQVGAISAVLREQLPEDATILDQAAEILGGLMPGVEETPQEKALKALERIEDEDLRAELKTYFEALAQKDTLVEEEDDLPEPEQPSVPAAKQVVDPPPVADPDPKSAATPTPALGDTPTAGPANPTPSLEQLYGDRLEQLEKHIAELREAPRVANPFPSGRQGPSSPQAQQKTVSGGDQIVDDMVSSIFGNVRGEA